MNVVILRKEGRRRHRTCDGILAELQKLGQQNVRVVRCHCETGRSDIVVRWGCTGQYAATYQINTPEMIRMGSDKIAARQRMIERGISTPRTFFTKEEAMAFNKYPIIGRKRQHREGREMVISRNAVDLMNDRQSEYWSEFIQKDREFRVYVFFGRILAVSEKIPDYPERVAWNKSLGNGAFVSIDRKDLPRSVGLLALQAADALNVDFSAVDIISKENKGYVLEFNNAPECSPYRQLLFARAFNWFIKRVEQTGEKPPHFKVPRTEQDKMILLCKD